MLFVFNTNSLHESLTTITTSKTTQKEFVMFVEIRNGMYYQKLMIELSTMTKIWLRWESADTCVSTRRRTGLENGTTCDDRNTNKLSRWLNLKMLQKWPY